MIEIYANTEKLLYIISNKKGEIPRVGIKDYAKPFSGKLEKVLNKGTVNLQSEEDLKTFLKATQEERFSGINFYNIGEKSNTIEFRIGNGTLDADTWIENINLFGGIVKAAEDLARIQAKEEITKEEQEKLKCFELLKDNQISEEEKLEALLVLAIPEENRNIYRERYIVNSRLLEQNPEIKNIITQNVAKTTIDLNKIGRKVFLGSDRVTGQEYYHGSTIIEGDIPRVTDEPSK